jgi:hypothetical protein
MTTRLQASITTLREAMTEAAEAVHEASIAIPDPPLDAAELLRQLAAAERDCRAWVTRWRTGHPWPERLPREAEDEWTVLHGRKDAVQSQLVRLALALDERPERSAEMAVVGPADVDETETPATLDVLARAHVA